MKCKIDRFFLRDVVQEVEQTLKVNLSQSNGQTMFQSSNRSHGALGSDWKSKLTNTGS